MTTDEATLLFACSTCGAAPMELCRRVTRGGPTYLEPDMTHEDRGRPQGGRIIRPEREGVLEGSDRKPEW